MSEIEQRILAWTNEARKKHGLERLRANARLYEATRRHAANCARHHRFAHVLEGQTLADRLKLVHYDCSTGGENGAMQRSHSHRDIFTGWRKSPGHRANLLNPAFKEIGIGIGFNPKAKEYYYVQVFGKPQHRTVASR